MPTKFELDLRLQADTIEVGDLPLSKVLLMNDSNYPWIILVPKRANISEVFQLSSNEQASLWQEVTMVAKNVQQLFSADKINIATLGNVVQQLHMHIVVRRIGDAAWPAPVWGKHPAQTYSVEQRTKLLSQIKQLVLSCNGVVNATK